MRISLRYRPRFLHPLAVPAVLRAPVRFTPDEDGSLHAALLIPADGQGEGEVSRDPAALHRHLDQGGAVLIVQGGLQESWHRDHAGEMELLVYNVMVVTTDAKRRAHATRLTAAGDPGFRRRIKALTRQALAQMQVYAS